MASLSLLNRLAVAKGAAVAVVVCLPLALVSNLVRDRNADSPFIPVLFLAVAAGFGLAGFVAARSEGDAPYSNGAVAALCGFLVVQAVAVVVRIAGHRSVPLGRIVGAALIAYAAGVAGAAVGKRR